LHLTVNQNVVGSIPTFGAKDTKMRYFEYSDLDGDYIISEEQILEEYWDYWRERMERAGKEDLINPENCIEDFCIINWAFEVL
jgi:hypothetical protein